ncbi:hypothetical protein [Metasolibacillus meyeri]|nr:hypothetical protein [Metasolibacillus meyeri]
MYETKDSYFFIANPQTVTIIGIVGMVLTLLLVAGIYFLIKKR